VHGELAEICGKHLAKGQKIHIRGEALRNAEGKGGRVIFAEAIYFAGAPPEAAIGESVADHDDNITRWLNYEELPEGVRARSSAHRSFALGNRDVIRLQITSIPGSGSFWSGVQSSGASTTSSS
jgi:hypothetical protein